MRIKTNKTILGPTNITYKNIINLQNTLGPSSRKHKITTSFAPNNTKYNR
jgi:hypothetical protein